MRGGAALAPGAEGGGIRGPRPRSPAAAQGRLESLSQVAGVLGTQWGDEGKGKLVDILAQRFDIVARCQLEMLEKQYHDELRMEYEGKTFSNRTADNQPDVVDKSDTKEADDHMEDSHKQAEKDAADISKTLMSRKQRGLLQAIEINQERKKDKVNLLKKRKKNADSSASAKGR
ncbi:hypothetical protein OsJ_12226 [Oryza sativa Japonica Group]|uniref:Adenylosuccinate synthetase n=1 Tax=Oryza sativa subsp. japonica TaxID=39947 RepID=A3ALR5_ORYSJ|nr:hypothetical protein OsJ_12226 [Oryza sativa Japonica Group]